MPSCGRPLPHQAVTLHTDLGDIKLELFCDQVIPNAPHHWFCLFLLPTIASVGLRDGLYPSVIFLCERKAKRLTSRVLHSLAATGATLSSNLACIPEHHSCDPIHDAIPCRIAVMVWRKTMLTAAETTTSSAHTRVWYTPTGCKDVRELPCAVREWLLRRCSNPSQHQGVHVSDRRSDRHWQGGKECVSPDLTAINVAQGSFWSARAPHHTPHHTPHYTPHTPHTHTYTHTHTHTHTQTNKQTIQYNLICTFSTFVSDRVDFWPRLVRSNVLN